MTTVKSPLYKLSNRTELPAPEPGLFRSELERTPASLRLPVGNEHLFIDGAADRAGVALETSPTLTARSFSSPRHTTRYWEAGPSDGLLMIFVHGWTEIGLIWRAQVEAFASEGWHCGSSTPPINIRTGSGATTASI